jgi:hypothetical protein
MIDYGRINHCYRRPISNEALPQTDELYGSSRLL